MPVRGIASNKKNRANYDNDRASAGKNCAIFSAFGTTLSRDRASLHFVRDLAMANLTNEVTLEIEFEAFVTFSSYLLLSFDEDSSYLIPSFTGPFASFFPNLFPTRAGSIRLSS
jgi:hypothetical protein